MDFISGQELLQLCEENGCRISDIMIQREISEYGASSEEILERMKEAYRIMKEACHKPLDEPVPIHWRPHRGRGKKGKGQKAAGEIHMRKYAFQGNNLFTGGA